MKPRAPAGSKPPREEVPDLATRARADGEELDVTGYDLAAVDLSGKDVHLKDVVFGRGHGPPPANVRGTLFRAATLDRCLLLEWVRVVQTLAGVALLGLFGLVLAEKIRSD